MYRPRTALDISAVDIRCISRLPSPGGNQSYECTYVVCVFCGSDRPSSAGSCSCHWHPIGGIGINSISFCKYVIVLKLCTTHTHKHTHTQAYTHTYTHSQAEYKSVKSRCRWGRCCSCRPVSPQAAALVTSALAFFCCVSKLFVERGHRARPCPELSSKLVYFIYSFQVACSTLLCSVFSWASNDSS